MKDKILPSHITSSSHVEEPSRADDFISYEEQCQQDLCFAEQGKAGAEIEAHILGKSEDGFRRPATKDMMKKLRRYMLQAHFVNPDLELAIDILEVDTAAFDFSNIQALLESINIKKRQILTSCLQFDLIPSPFAVIAGRDHAMHASDLITIDPEDIDTFKGLHTVSEFHQTNSQHLMYNGLTNTSSHLSISSPDADSMWRSMRRHNYLLPFFMVAFHNRPPVFDDNGQKVYQNTAVTTRRDLRDRGLVSEAFYESTNGQEYIENYARRLFERPMFFYLDNRGEYHIVDDCDLEEHSLKALSERGLATAANLDLSRRFDWFSVKVKTVEGTSDIRTELRDIDSSAFSTQTLAIYGMLTAFDQDCADEVDNLLRHYGFHDIPAENRDLIESQLEDVKDHSNKYFDRAYGNGRMSDFAKDFFAIISKYADRHNIAPEVLEPFRLVCEQGMPEARVIDEECDTLQDVLQLQEDSVVPLFSEANVSLGLLRQRKQQEDAAKADANNGAGQLSDEQVIAGRSVSGTQSALTSTI